MSSSLTNPGAAAGVLAAKGYVSIISTSTGWGLFGNRTFSATDSTDAQRFVNVYRQYEDIVAHLERSAEHWMRSNIVGAFFDRVTNDVNNYLSLLVAAGAIVDGECTVDPGLNTPTALAAGDTYFTLDYQPSYPVTRIFFDVHITTPVL